MRSAVFAAVAGATLLAGVPATAAAAPAPKAVAGDAVQPVQLNAGTGSAGTGSAAAFDTGSSAGATTTGSSGTGSATALESLLFGGPLLCAAIGSAMNRNLTCPGTAGPVIP
ncbi:MULTISPECIES: hypothetical protein [Nocardia]|uniref:hypothetical protein n=1 Tax=Nocardia TaxID=1817 RepID=UPI001E652D1A|nr:hypothetical protein [Nocardia asteroides]UGT60393.1 hypothetical protein LTT61_24850 [Nocardia asteroides]